MTISAAPAAIVPWPKRWFPLDRFKERFGEVSEKVIREAMLPLIVDKDQIELSCDNGFVAVLERWSNGLSGSDHSV